MKFLYWSVGVLQIFTGLMLAWSIAPAWRWVWITCAIYWFFAGIVFAVLGLGKLVAGKVSAGRAGKSLLPSQPAPAQHNKEE